MKIKNIQIDITQDDNESMRVKLTKRLPNGRTYIRYIGEDEGLEVVSCLFSFVGGANNKIEQVEGN